MNYSAGVSTLRAPDLTMVVPTYNEKDRLAELVAAVFAASEAYGLTLELVVVDDNSPDGTGQLADRLAAQYPIRVIHRSGKLGLGTAVVAGFEVASAEAVGVMDADFSHPPSLVPVLFAAFRTIGADVAVASRYVPGGSTPDWPLRRRLLSRTACLLARGLSPVRDAASGFFIIKRAIAKGTTIKAGGFKICLELIVRGDVGSLVELPYRFNDRELGQSKMSMREAAGYLVQLRDLYLERLFGSRRPAHRYRQLSSVDVAALMRS